VADPADIGNERAELHLAAALKRALGKSAPESHPDFDGKNCLDCEEPILVERLALGKIRCVHCQSVLERRGKMMAAK
jgi:RNA polymerase-binding transcription factor DksA